MTYGIRPSFNYITLSRDLVELRDDFSILLPSPIFHYFGRSRKINNKTKISRVFQKIYFEGSFYGNCIAKFQLKRTDTTRKSEDYINT